MNRHIFSGSKANRDRRDASAERDIRTAQPDGAVFKATGEPVVSKRRQDLRCEHGHALYEYHGLERGVGHRILCPVCDRDYIRELIENR